MRLHVNCHINFQEFLLILGAFCLPEIRIWPEVIFLDRHEKLNMASLKSRRLAFLVPSIDGEA